MKDMRNPPRQNKLRYPTQMLELLRDFGSIKLSAFTQWPVMIYFFY
jgi:hypothetical protein